MKHVHKKSKIKHRTKHDLSYREQIWYDARDLDLFELHLEYRVLLVMTSALYILNT